MSKITTRAMGLVAALFVLIVVCTAYGKFISQPTPGPDAPADAAQGSLEVELVTLRPEGFEPSEITRPKGSFVLLIEDRSGKENSSYQLQRVKGERLRDVNTNRKKSKWYEVVNLPPGDYVLTDTANSDRRCPITILP